MASHNVKASIPLSIAKKIAQLGIDTSNMEVRQERQKEIIEAFFSTFQNAVQNAQMLENLRSLLGINKEDNSSTIPPEKLSFWVNKKIEFMTWFATMKEHERQITILSGEGLQAYTSKYANYIYALIGLMAIERMEGNVPDFLTPNEVQTIERLIDMFRLREESKIKGREGRSHEKGIDRSPRL